MFPAAEHGTPKPDFYYDVVNEELLELLPPAAERFLDVGCARGRLGEEIKKRRPGAVVHGIELDPGAAEQAAKRLDRVFRIDLERELAGLEETYDCIACGDVLEHLVDPWTVLRALTQRLAPGGHVVASLPNLRLWEVVRDLAWNGRFTYREAGVLDSTHLRFFTLHEMKRLFESAGLEVVAVRPRLHRRPRWLRRLDRVLGGRLRDFRTIQYVLAGRLRPAA